MGQLKSEAQKINFLKNPLRKAGRPKVSNEHLDNYSGGVSRSILQGILHLLQMKPSLSSVKISTTKKTVAFPGLLIWTGVMLALIILKVWLNYIFTI